MAPTTLVNADPLDDNVMMDEGIGAAETDMEGNWVPDVVAVDGFDVPLPSTGKMAAEGTCGTSCCSSDDPEAEVTSQGDGCAEIKLDT